MPHQPRHAHTPNSQYLYIEAVRAAMRGCRRWLDIGCGHQLLQAWMNAEPLAGRDRSCWIVGLDVDRRALARNADVSARVAGDSQRLPIRSGTLDLVTANMVIEHVAEPAALFGEVHRVLRPGGSFLFHTPNALGYTTLLTHLIPPAWRPAMAGRLQGRKEEDVYPTFYRANTTDALSEIAAAQGFRRADIRTVNSSPQLYKVPVAGFLEERLLRALKSERWAERRACIIGRFTKP